MKLNKKWLLKTQVMIPLSPKSPNSYNVQIFANSEVLWDPFTGTDYPKFLSKIAIEKGADRIIKEHQKSPVDYFPERANISLLYVFRESPPVGTEIKIEQFFDHGRKQTSTTFIYPVMEPSPYFVIQGRAKGYGGGYFETIVRINGKKIASRTLDLR